jgi:hypothetical protein
MSERDQDLAALRQFLSMARETSPNLTGYIFTNTINKDLFEEYVSAIEDCIAIIEAGNGSN